MEGFEASVGVVVLVAVVVVAAAEVDAPSVVEVAFEGVAFFVEGSLNLSSVCEGK